MHQFLADLVLLIHAGFVVFVVASLPLILFGGWRRWRWVRNPWFRLLHLLGIGIVVAQAWMGVICPLTNVEIWLRGQAGQATYEGSFIAYWVTRALYYEAPAWVFVVIYSVFGLLVIAGLWLVPPRFERKRTPT